MATWFDKVTMRPSRLAPMQTTSSRRRAIWERSGFRGRAGPEPLILLTIGRLLDAGARMTDHLRDPGRWDHYCRYHNLDPNQHSPAIPVRVKGIRPAYHPYQAFGKHVMWEMEMFQNGGYLADDMGLGKVGRVR